MLAELLTLPSRPLIAIVGAGGKTTTMYTLAAELARRGRRVVTTTTTHIYIPRPGETETLLVSADLPRLLKMLADAWPRQRHITVAERAIGSGKLAGLPPEAPFAILSAGGADVVIVEADGARHRLLKAPAEHEPVIPARPNVALMTMSARAINQPLDPEIVHRPERVAEVAGLALGEPLTPAHIARLLTSTQGGLKSVPPEAATYVLMTQLEEANREAAREVAKLTQEMAPGIAGVLGSMQPGVWDRI